MLASATGGSDASSAASSCAPAILDGADAPWAAFDFECIGPDGRVKWRETCRNIVTNEGKRLLMDVMFGATAKPTWFVLLKGAGAVANGDSAARTPAPAWAEVTAYAAATRPGITFGASVAYLTTGAEVSNGTVVPFAINADNTVIAGAGLITNSTKAGTTGTLYNVGDFASSRTMGNGDSLNVTMNIRQNP